MANEHDEARRRAAREERRTLRDEVRRSIRGTGIGHDLGKHIRRTIRDSMSFNIDVGDLIDAAGDDYSETIERDFAVGQSPGLHVRNVSGDTRVRVGEDGNIHVIARKRVRGTSEERAKRLLENVEVRMEQNGDEVLLKPHLYEQDRGWADLFRGGRVAVDFELTVPREVRLEAHTVSGDLVLEGTRGPIDVQSVSGDVRLSDAQGPMRLKTVSGDATLTGYAGQLLANSVSGDLALSRVRLHGSEIVTVSGDVRVGGELDQDREHRMKTISGDVDLHLAGGSYDIRFKSMSGDVESELDGEILHEGRRDKHIVIGAGATPVSVKTMSGDLRIKASAEGAPEATEASSVAQADVVWPAAERAERGEAVERTEPMAPATPRSAGVDVRDLLERVARGEVDVDAAATALDASRER